VKIVIFGLAMSSSWGNGHATLWRGLVKALIGHGHGIVFFEKDVPYYASTRDFGGLAGLELVLYPEWNRIGMTARQHLSEADAAIVTSFCPDGVAASAAVLSSNAKAKVFYDMDTPVTLKALESGASLSYIGPEGLRDFDLVLSYTGGQALTEMRSRLGARNVAPLYGSVDPDLHKPVPGASRFRSDLSFLGTYAADRKDALCRLLVEPARRLPNRRFRIAGAQYPEGFPWTRNIYYNPHVSPPEHAEFYSSSGFTLNLTRESMARMGYCPSGRLFEAAACGCPMLSDEWDGLEHFFRPDTEIVVVRTAADVMTALARSPEDKQELARAARTRVLSSHTAEHRAAQLESLLRSAMDTEKPATAGVTRA